jgi:hypothetical protein
VDTLLFIISSLAVWRITHLIAKEDGPFDFMFMVRKKAGTGFWGSLFDCFYCVSIWMALPFGIWIGHNWREDFICWLGLSGAACLLEQATTKTLYKNNSKTADYTED